MSSYADVRAAIADGGSDARVEVNQRALIDKILARYASAGAVYRELLQNSNDAEAAAAEIIMTTSRSQPSTGPSPSPGGTKATSGAATGPGTSSGGKELVTQVTYRNDGKPFGPRDWARLRKIAEGNPDESKVGAFGVGAYTMFSVCEEPVVVSGERGKEEAMAFFWKGDGLWTKTGKAPEGILNASASPNGEKDDRNWTSFILPSRDPYPLPDLVEFGQFLAASLTFTKCLRRIRVYVNGTLNLDVEKTILESHTIATPKASSWWRNDGASTTSSSGMFTLGKGSDLTQTSVRMSVSLRSKSGGMDTSTVKARYASALARTSIPAAIEKRMIRVTKKRPPRELTVQILIDAADDDRGDEGAKESKSRRKKSGSASITSSFAPSPGEGRVFIGFRTSQTTGLGVHLAAPLLPTVEREAIDFVDPALKEYNSELLEMGGILMRLALEHEMGRIGTSYDEGAKDRKKWDEEDKCRREEEKRREKEGKSNVREVNAGEEKKEDAQEKETIQSSLFSFARFMAKGVKETVTEAIKSVPATFIGEDDETTELLNPSDERPLCIEERDAIVLMRAFCPKKSTPDSLVGQCLAKGFVYCLPKSSPPVLTAGGVARGGDAKLPNAGMEAFGFDRVVRRVMLENAREYYETTADVTRLTANDLVQSLRNRVIDEKELVRLLKWWPRACRADRSLELHGTRLREAVRFHVGGGDAPLDIGRKSRRSDEVESVEVRRLDSIPYYAAECLLGLPLPETCWSATLQKEIGRRTLEGAAYRGWFSPLPFDVWASYVSTLPCMMEGRPSDENVKVLVALGKRFDSLDEGERRRLVELLPVDSPCLPYDDESTREGEDEGGQFTAVPKELYLASSDLSAFAGVGVFRKASKSLAKAGVSDAFLLGLGVRTTISVDFLFLHLDTLRWNRNPKPLITYLLAANLSSSDLLKLRCTQYLPAEDDQTSVFAPSELYLKNDDLKIFPFVKFLQWPASEGMSAKQKVFLTDLGVRADPTLASVMSFLEEESKKSEDERDEMYGKALRFLTSRLGPQGIYERDFSRFKTTKFLPCIRQNLETGDVVREMQSPSECYYNPSVIVMGFSTLDPQLDTVHVATRTKCNKDPSCKVLINRLIQLVNISRSKVEFHEKKGCSDAERKDLAQKLLSLFDGVFAYLASRASDFDKKELAALAKKPFIPCLSRGQIVFYLPSQIFFQKESLPAESDHDSLAETLFQQTKYNAFLSLAGVKAEPSLQEIFDLMIEKPDEVLDSLGENKYKMLLRRIASDPPFKKITERMKDCPFLLGYLVIDKELGPEGAEGDGGDEGENEGQKAQYVLARAQDIFIVDNSFLRRQFPMLVSPMEQALEEFYNQVGSRYVSEVVKKEYEVHGGTRSDTALTRSLTRRIRERRPLLLSPTNSSRPLAPSAAKVLNDQHLEIIQADTIQAKYSFERSSKHLKVTCCSKQKTKQKTNIYITTNPDWFDIGSVIGSLILQRCQLEDALLLSQLLESPLETLRYRGFPVDRILRPVSKPPPPPPPPPHPAPMPPAQMNPTPHSDVNPHSEVKGNTANGNSHTTVDANRTDESGFGAILSQMFPSCPPDVIQGLLGPNPTKEKAKQVADMLGAECPPGDDTKNTGMDAEKPPTSPMSGGLSTAKKHMDTKKKSSSFMNKMLKGFGVSAGSTGGKTGSTGGKNGSTSGKKVINQPPILSQTDSSKPSSPESDAFNQKSLEAMLSQAIQSSRSVDNAGIRSQETIVNHLPQGLERGNGGCEVIPAKNLHPFQGPHGDGKTRNGIKVFSASGNSPAFLSQNFNAADRFSVVIGQLSGVFKLHIRTVAIYHDSNGGAIAFNSNRALYFNLRFFCALHQNRVDAACYSYWYMTFAHELAHNLVTAHNKEHASFTEHIASLYLPDFVRLLTQIS